MSLLRASLLIAIALFASFIFVLGNQSSPYAPQEGANFNSKAQAAVQRLFGPDLEPQSNRDAFFVTGDFNGDRWEDLAVLVRIKATTSSLPKEVKVLKPLGIESKSSTELSSPQLALAIVHGSREGWDTETPVARFLVMDKEFFSTPIWESGQGTPISIMKKRSLMPKPRSSLPRIAKGDAIGLSTEAGIDIYLYWNGQTYKVYQDPNETP
jgi:hypothetical protein